MHHLRNLFCHFLEKAKFLFPCLCCILHIFVSCENIHSWNMSTVVGWNSMIRLGPGTQSYDPQQTGFKGNLRLLIKPFEQPHLPFKILSAALRCSGRACCVLPPPLTFQFGPGFSLLCPKSEGPCGLLQLAFSLCPAEINHNKRVSCHAHLCTLALLFLLSDAAIYL